MLELGYDYKSVVKNSERVEWSLDDVMPEDTRLDFTKPFLPSALVPVDSLTFLDAAQQKTLNHVTSNAYLNIFAFVEEYIIALALEHAHAEMFGDRDAIRALTRFADEEVKHQTLFLRFCAAFERDFGHPCDVLAAPAEVATVILSKSRIAVLLVTLHLELITQQHYTDSVKDDVGIDPFFTRLLKFHWLEESQHARIDLLELDKLLVGAPRAQIAKAVDDYLELLESLDALLASQADMDVTTFVRATGRALSDEERQQMHAVQHRNYRSMFLLAGVEHRMVRETLERIDPEGARRVALKAGGLR